MYEEYQLYGAQAQSQGQLVAVSGSPSSIANRVSYFCNFHGPSLAVDTMCSSSLTAIHLACQSIQQGDCEAAIAGGVNVSVHPNKYLLLGQNQFVSSQGHCESFGQGADGYVPAEGVVAGLLKPLAQAERDGDHIYGVIKATAINHGGKTNGYTRPKPHTQTEVIARALREAKIDPRTISYIEAHGTGTVLGDPIEIAGLTRAFAQGMQDHVASERPEEPRTATTGWCAIGSVKSNIGHAESASGIAGLTKVLLQMRYGQLVPTLHAEVLNPHIDFEATPFVVQRELSAWQRPLLPGTDEGKGVPRRAGISSFGAGGSNAHVILEEYMQRQQDSLERETDQIPSQPALIVLSARTAEQLHEQVQRLLNWLEQQEWSKQAVGQPQEQSKARSLLDNLAYTLQVGREAMEERLAVLVASLQELEEKLHSYVSSSAHEGGDWYRGQVKRNDPMRAFAADEDGQKTIAAWISKGKYEKLLEWWVRGLTVDWEDLHREHRPRRISLPTYPFARQRYWISTPKVESAESLTRPAPPQGTHKGCRDTGTDTPREPFRTIVGASLVGALGEETLPRRISLPPRPSLMETTLLIPGWKEAEIPSPGPSEEPLLASAATRGLVPVVFLCELASIHASRIQAQMASGERCRSLHSQRARRKERFQDIVVQLTQEIQSLLPSRLPGKQVEAMGMGLASPPSAAVPLLVQVVVASR